MSRKGITNNNDTKYCWKMKIFQKQVLQSYLLQSGSAVKVLQSNITIFSKDMDEMLNTLQINVMENKKHESSKSEIGQCNIFLLVLVKMFSLHSCRSIYTMNWQIHQRKSQAFFFLFKTVPMTSHGNTTLQQIIIQ
jgi:hypothetical protein